MGYRRVVIKIGSNVLSRADGSLDTTRMSALVDQVATLHRGGTEIVMVSSGAVASGRGELAGCSIGKLDDVSARQLFSAVGQAKLINRYYDMFRDWRIACGQVLTTKESLSTRDQYLNQKNCMEVMLRNGVVPIVNENDTISVSELMFTDNDELSGMVASMMEAEALVILSNVDGIYDGDPSCGKAQVIREVLPTDSLEDYISPARSTFGRGGMLTKTRIAGKVAGEGIDVFIANGSRRNILCDLLLGGDVIHTRFRAADKPVSGVKRWIAHSEGFAKGSLTVNEGALEAITGPVAKSVLPVGVTAVDGDFEKDDIIYIKAPSGVHIGLGKANADSNIAKESIGTKGARPLIHCDYLYIYPECLKRG